MSRNLQRIIHVRCPVSQAFAAFTEQIDLWWPRGHRRFAESRLQLEARVGGRFTERAAAGDEVRLGEVLVCEPPNHICYSWHPGAVDAPTRVDVRFIDEGDRTRVEVTHSEGTADMGDAWPGRAALFQRGWDLVLPSYADFAAGGPDRGRNGAQVAQRSEEPSR